MEKPWRHTFENNHTADIIQVHDVNELSDALHKIGIQTTHPTLVLVGGASGISAADMSRLHQLFVEVLAPIAEVLKLAIVDGGTDAGIMRLIGQARMQIGATFPLIGVAAVGTVLLSEASSSSDGAPLEPNHTHVVLVPGTRWGDESPWLCQLASVLAAGFPSVTLVINGGEITWQDVSQSVQAGRPVVTLAGTGRTADKIAAALRGEATDGRATQLVAVGKVQAIDLIKRPTLLAQVMKAVYQN